MPEMDFFPQRPDSHPVVYAYELLGVASHKGYIKVGYTERDVDTRIKEQLHTAAVPYRLLAYWSAMKNDGSEYDSLFNLKHSDCYEVYGMTRTGCAGCPFNRKLNEEMAIIEKYELKLAKAVKNIFKDSYEYTRKYRDFVNHMKNKTK